MNFILCEMSIEHCVSIKCDNTESLSLSSSVHDGKNKGKKKNNQRNEFIIEAWDLNIFWYIVWLYPSLYICISPSKSIQSATHQSHFVIHVAYEQIDHLISLMLRFASGNLSTPAVEKHNIFLVYPQFPHHTHSCSVFIYLFDWIRIILPCRGKKKAPKIVD